MRIHSLSALAVLLLACSSSEPTPAADDTTSDQGTGGAGAGGTTSAGGSGGGAKDGGKAGGGAAAGGATGMGGSTAAGGSTGSGGGAATGGATGTGGSTGSGGNGAGGTTTSDLTGTCTAPSDPSAATINLSIDRSAVPQQVGFRDLTLRVKVNTATAVAVKVDGQSPPCAYDSTSGTVLFTTAGASVVISVSGGQPASSGFGTFTKAALEDDKKWAYSFGFDDDQEFKQGIRVAESLGMRGTVFIMNKDDSQLFASGRNEGWTLGEDDVPILERGGSIQDTNPASTFSSAGGWGIGNHSWSHSYVADLGGAAAAKADIVKMQDKLFSILGIPGTDAYKIIAFAAPMFDASYEPIIQDIRDHDPAHQLLFDESGSSMPLQVDGPLDRNASIGRANTYGFGNGSGDDPKTVIAGFRSKLDATHHYWLNTLDHGVDTSYPNGAFFQWVQYFHDTYGKGGTNEAWNAPSDRIYSYLLVRDLSVVTKH
jgi:hypothetical protein